VAIQPIEWGRKITTDKGLISTIQTEFLQFNNGKPKSSIENGLE
jgi:hypothetical protein